MIHESLLKEFRELKFAFKKRPMLIDFNLKAFLKGTKPEYVIYSEKKTFLQIDFDENQIAFFQKHYPELISDAGELGY